MRKALVLAFLFMALQSGAQSKVSAVTPATFNIGGGSAKINSSFIVDWSIGESTVIETYYGENTYSNLIVGKKWNVTSGILQPYDKNHIIFNSLVPHWTLQEIRLYPVPTSDVIYIDFRSTTTGKITMQLLTLSGKLLAEKQFTQINGHSTQSWNLKNQPSGSYYIKILLSSTEGKILKQGTFKFEKIN
jgi:hypothetical protein